MRKAISKDAIITLKSILFLTNQHWACALGRMETTLVMYYMDRMSLDEVNKDGMTPLSLARAFRNKHIVVSARVPSSVGHRSHVGRRPYVTVHLLIVSLR